MRIGLLIPQFPSQTHIAMWRVGNAMRELGAEVRVLSTRRPEADERCHKVLEDESRSTFYAWPPRPLPLAGGLGRSLPRTLHAARYYSGLRESTRKERLRLTPLLVSAWHLRAWAARNRIEHIFVHSCANAAHLVALCHELGGPTYSLRLGGDIEIYGKDQQSKMRRASFILAAARVNVDQIREQVGLPDQRLMWSWLGVDTRRFRPVDSAAHSMDQPRTEPFHAVSVGRLHVAKGHEHALRAMKRLVEDGHELRYTIGGSGPHEQFLRDLVRNLGLGDRVDFVGALDQQQVLATLQTADLFLLPSVGRGEASPVAVIEAMACGVPVIASIIGGTRDMVTDGVDGFLVPMGDEDAIVDRWRTLVTDADLHQKFSRAARHRAVTSFDCRQVAKKVLDRIVREIGSDWRPADPAGLPDAEPAIQTSDTTRSGAEKALSAPRPEARRQDPDEERDLTSLPGTAAG
ncbi:MAG: glycosyltransferase [Planctomycetota bacterium]